MIKHLTIVTRTRTEMIDITEQVRGVLFSSSVREGICQVFSPHTTAGLTINENADPDVRADIMETLNRIVPWKAGYHHEEGNSAAHIKTVLTGSSLTLPVEEGRLILGTWQCIYFCEFDGPRTRTVIVNVMGS
jgi:secondary thiamine-phosphate synthase enzyme